MTDTKNFMKQNKIHPVVGVKYPILNGDNSILAFEGVDPKAFSPITYYYKNPGYDINENDLVLTIVNNDFRIAKVYEVVDDNMTNMEKVNIATKSILGTVDLSCKIQEYKDKQRQVYLQNKIEEMKRQFEAAKMLELLAGSDPEAAKLIDEYKTLTKRIGQ